jgi:antitoxin component of RelBE/YafQ-DinJ toxin-antitoxin module
MPKIGMSVKVDNKVKEQFDKVADAMALNRSKWVENLMKSILKIIARR